MYKIGAYKATLIGSILLISAMSLSGCFVEKMLKGTPELDTQKISTQILQNYKRHNLPVTSVKCPKEVVLQKDLIFKCQVTGKDGTSVNMPLKQVNERGNVEPVVGLINSESVEEDLVDFVTHETGATINKIVCPDVALQKTKSTFVCRITSGKGSKISVLVKLTDNDGGFTHRLLE